MCFFVMMFDTFLVGASLKLLQQSTRFPKETFGDLICVCIDTHSPVKHKCVISA